MVLVWQNSRAAMESRVAAVGGGARAKWGTHPISPTTAMIRTPRSTVRTLIFGVIFITRLSRRESASMRPNRHRSWYWTGWAGHVDPGSPSDSCDYGESHRVRQAAFQAGSADLETWCVK